jgi:hypothetical protein
MPASSAMARARGLDPQPRQQRPAPQAGDGQQRSGGKAAAITHRRRAGISSRQPSPSGRSIERVNAEVPDSAASAASSSRADW